MSQRESTSLELFLPGRVGSCRVAVGERGWRRVVWAGLAVVLMAGSVAMADIKLIPGKNKDKERQKAEEKRMEQLGALSPEVKATEVSFVEGRSVDVELDAASAFVTGLRFLIREQPVHGRLSNLRPHPKERHKAIVTYTHTSKEFLNDSFQYACRINEGPFSAPAKVTLTGRRAEPKLEILKQAQFGRVLPGAEVMAKVTVANHGIGPFARDLVWPKPWQGPPRLDLGIGESVELAVLVTPDRPGILSEEVTLQEGNPKSRVRLWLQCEQPFIVTPGRAQMAYDKERGLRWVKARIANATKDPMTLKLLLPERLKGPGEVTVAANQLREVELTLAADDVAAFQGDVHVTDGVLSERLSLGASPEPAQIQLVAPVSGVLQFGSRHQGEVGKATLVLANRGGEAAVMAIQAPPPFRVPDDGQSLSVAAGMTRQLVMEVVSAKAGRYEGKVVLSGDGNRVELNAEAQFTDPNVMQMKAGKSKDGGKPVVAAVAGAGERVARPRAAVVAEPQGAPADEPPAAKAKPAPEVGAPKRQEEAVTAMGKVGNQAAAVLSYLSVFGAPIPEDQLSAKYGKLTGIQMVDRGRDFLDVVWEKPNPDSPPQSYRVEAASQVYVPATKMFFRDWAPVTNVKPLQPGEDKEGIRLTGLRPGSHYELRFMAVDERGKVSPPSDIYILATKAPWRIPGWMWVAGGLLVLGGLLVQARRLYLKRMGLS